MAYYDFRAQGSGAKAYYLGTLEHGQTKNIASLYSDYASLTADNFVVVPQTHQVTAIAVGTQVVDAGITWRETDQNVAIYTAPTKNYNASTGVFSFSSTVATTGLGYGGTPSQPNKGWARTVPSKTEGVTADVYLLPEIETLT